MLTEQNELIAPVPAVWKLKVQAERWCRCRTVKETAGGGYAYLLSNHAYLAQPAEDSAPPGSPEHAAGVLSPGGRCLPPGAELPGMSQRHGRTPCCRALRRPPSTA